MALGRETMLLLETFMRLRSSLKDHTLERFSKKREEEEEEENEQH